MLKRLFLILPLIFVPLFSYEGKGGPDQYYVILDPRHRTMLSAEVSSIITTVTKKMGESFEQGEILIQLDDTIFQGQSLKAKAHLQQAQTEVDAKRELYKDNAASLLELKDAEANFAAAQADSILAQKHLNACTILAPYKGKVIGLNFEKYELVQPGEELIEIVDDSVLIAKFLIPSILLKHIHVGRIVDIYIKEIESTVQATIKRISAIIDPASSTVKIDAEIDNERGDLRSGMTGTLKL